MAANTDKFKKGARRFTTTIGAGGIVDASVTTVPLASVTGLPTDTAIEITVDRVDSSGNLTLTNEEIITGVISGNNLITCIRGVEGAAQSHSAGAVVEVRLTADQWDDVMDGILEEHNQDGTHDIIDLVYPVGAVYISVASTSPATLFGGTWVAFGAGRTLVGIDTSVIDFETVEETGGHKDMQEHTHVIDSVGDHSHSLAPEIMVGSQASSAYNVGLKDDTSSASAYSKIGQINDTSASSNTGSSGSHTHTAQNTGAGDSGNLQPYIVTYMWKRTA